MKDLIIVGSGPAGLSAAIYGKRARLDLTVIEKFSPGGQIVNTYEIENYPGFAEPVEGWKLAGAMEEQAKRLEAEILNGEVIHIEKDQKTNSFKVKLSGGEILESRAVIVACGALKNKLGIPGEIEFIGKGVSYCATCDGAFFKDKITAVAGGGNSALEEALFLTRFSSKVYLIIRRDKFRGSQILQDRVKENAKIEIIYNTLIESINGESKVTSISLKDIISNRKKDIPVDGIFIFIGFTPNTSFLADNILNPSGEIIVDKNLETTIPGLFAAGDIRENSKRQIITAASDGATALLNAYDYLFK